MAKGKMHSGHRHYDEDEDTLSCGHWCEYILVVVLSSLLLLASLVLVLFWALYYRKGFAWNENPTKQFNLHPTLMVAGFISFSGFSMLLYRISRCCRKLYAKLFHMIFHALAIPCVVLGFIAVWDSRNLADPPLPNFYSMHSWMGFVTMGLFAFQFVVGFFSFIILLCCEGATAAFRASLVPVHASFGIITFMMAVATCLTGLTEKAFIELGDEYSKFSEEGIIINALAMVLVALGILISYTVRREPLRVDSTKFISERL
uniref:Cytochrome b561 domain-containing protein n=1 Tax=Clastoptera arizonana TaxID=38151 RepID=A0A1B6CL74_9HEMI